MGRLHGSLRLFHTLKRMEWHHLPVSGGWYDQHPGFVDDMDVIMSAEADAEKKKQNKQQQQKTTPTRGGKRR